MKTTVFKVLTPKVPFNPSLVLSMDSLASAVNVLGRVVQVRKILAPEVNALTLGGEVNKFIPWVSEKGLLKGPREALELTAVEAAGSELLEQAALGSQSAINFVPTWGSLRKCLREIGEKRDIWGAAAYARYGPAGPPGQKPNESFVGFTERLRVALDASELPPEARGAAGTDLASQNANAPCRRLLQRLPSSSSLAQRIEAGSKAERLESAHGQAGLVAAVVCGLKAAILAAPSEQAARGAESGGCGGGCDLIITAGGENVPPIPIEDAVKRELPIVSNAMVIGDKKKFLSMLLTLKSVLDPDTSDPTDILTEQARDFCQKIGSKATKVSEIVATRDQAIYQAIQEGINKVNMNATNRVHCIQKWIVLPKDFSISGGELGPTMKLKRLAVLAKYRNEV
ncbi:uncharacterized protein O3Q21_013369 [Podargus strigoides]